MTVANAAVAGINLNSPSLPFADRAAAAFAEWIDAMGPVWDPSAQCYKGGPYVQYATAAAQAEANYENFATVAATQNANTSTTTPDDSVALAQNAQAYAAQAANLQAAELLAVARADAAHELAEAQYNSELANSEVEDQETYEENNQETYVENSPSYWANPSDYNIDASQQTDNTALVTGNTVALRRPTRSGPTACSRRNTTLPWARPWPKPNWRRPTPRPTSKTPRQWRCSTKTTK